MRLVICWPEISGYMAACWRALAQVADVELRVIAFSPPDKTFSDQLVRGINCRLLSASERDDAGLIESLVKEHKPDALYTSGWFHPPYRRLVTLPELAGVSKWTGLDTPWMGTMRQRVGRFALRGFMRNFDRVFVAGERAWQYMRVLGVPEAKVRRGLYACDYDQFAPLHEARVRRHGASAGAIGGWPPQFLYTGRYVPAKGLEVLIEGYRRYRAAVNQPWPLACVGSGSEQHLLRDQPGVRDLGFKQPHELGEVMLDAGVFVIASRFEPWGVVVAEALAAGLPVVCTESVSASVELVRSYYNGITVATEDAAALARALRWMHDHPEMLPEMGLRGRGAAAAFSSQVWAMRWAESLRECCGGR